MSKEKINKIQLFKSREKENQKNFDLKEININKDLMIQLNSEKKFTKNYKNEELNIFRDDILQYFKDNFEECSKKLNIYLTRINKIEHNFEQNTNTINSNYNSIILNQANMNIQLDKLKDYEFFYNKTNDKLISHEIRLNNIRDELSKATQKYDKIYLDNLELPGYIGRCAKYKNCQIFFNDVIKEISSLNQYKEKNILDLKSYKDKLENIIKSFNILVDNNNKSQIKYINKLNQKNISDCQGMIDILEERIRGLKVENAKYSMDIIRKSEELSKKWDKIEDIKREILAEYELKSNEYKNLNENTLNKFNEFKNEYKIIRDKFFELAEFIKDIRFKKNIRNMYGENLKKKDIKNICNSLNEININKKERIINKDVDIDLLKDISSIEKNKFINNNDDKNNKKDNTIQNTIEEITQEKLNEYFKKNKYHFKKLAEFNSPILYGIKSSLTNGKDNKISFLKNNKIIGHNSEKNLNLYYMNTNNYHSHKNLEREENKNNLKNSSKKGSQKIFINSNDGKEKSNKEIIEIKDIKKEEEKIINNLSSSQKIIKNKNYNGTEDSNSLMVDNQSTFVNINNSINDNNISISSISAFCLNNNNNNNRNIINDICLDSNDKVIKELASELEQSTAKKDFNSNKKDDKYKLNKNIIEPLNLIKTIQEEKELPDSSSSLRYKVDTMLLNSNHEHNNYSNKKTELNTNSFNNTINSINLNRLINEKEFNALNVKSNNKNNEELLLYGNNPREIDKKFLLTDKKILDLEEYTKGKILDIIAQIDKLKTITKNTIKHSGKKVKDINVNMKEKNSFNLYRGIISYNNKNKNEETIKSNSNINTKKNIFKGLNFKNDENNNPNDLTNFEKNRNAFDLTGYNFHKSKLYNFEQINPKIFNSSCKKIKTYSNLNDLDINIRSTKNKGKEFIKNNILNNNDKNFFEEKESDNKDNKISKKFDFNEINKIKNNELKKIKYRNNSSGNIYLTQKRGDSSSFNEADIKLVYLNKFVNDFLPYAPIEGFSNEEKK